MEPPAGCPGLQTRQMNSDRQPQPDAEVPPSQLSHWPVQLNLVPPGAPFLHDADLLLVADCVPFALPDFHSRFLRGRPVVVGCPKLDDPHSYVDKLKAIYEHSLVRSLTIIHMEVPCCTGLCRIAELATKAGGNDLPIREVTVSIEGRILEERDW
jgi:hypothetical protein